MSSKISPGYFILVTRVIFTLFTRRFFGLFSFNFKEFPPYFEILPLWVHCYLLCCIQTSDTVYPQHMTLLMSSFLPSLVYPWWLMFWYFKSLICFCIAFTSFTLFFINKGKLNAMKRLVEHSDLHHSVEGILRGKLLSTNNSWKWNSFCSRYVWSANVREFHW